MGELKKRAEAVEHIDRVDQAENITNADLSEQEDGIEQAESANNTDKAEKVDNAEKADKAEKVDKADESKPWTLESNPEEDMHVRDLDRPDPVKKDFKSRFLRVSDAFGDFFFLNLMFVVGCLPLVTIGTSFCALHTVMQKRLRNEDGKITKDFWSAYKANLKQGILVWLLVLLYVGVCLLGIYVCVNTSGTISNVIMCIDGILLILMLFIFPFLFPLIARYENSTFNVFKNALILSLSEFPTWFMMVFPWVAVIVVYVFVPILFYMTWFLWCMILVSLIVYSEATLMKKVFDKLESKMALQSENTSGK